MENDEIGKISVVCQTVKFLFKTSFGNVQKWSWTVPKVVFIKGRLVVENDGKNNLNVASKFY